MKSRHGGHSITTPAKPPVDVFRNGAELGHVETRGAGRLDAEIAAGDLAAECEPLEIEKPPRPLQIGQRVRVGGRQALELRARRDLKLERLHELGIVTLQDAKQRRNIS